MAHRLIPLTPPLFFHFTLPLKVHKIDNFFDSDFGIRVISLLVISKYSDFTKKIF